jgi:hypothetical protein
VEGAAGGEGADAEDHAVGKVPRLLVGEVAAAAAAVGGEGAASAAGAGGRKGPYCW